MRQISKRKPGQKMTQQEIIDEYGHDPIEVLHKVGGYYECPKDSNGKRLGPVVGYAAEYAVTPGGEKKHYVGDVYANFAIAEQYPQIMHFFANQLMRKIPLELRNKITDFCGLAMGGISITDKVALVTGKQFAYIEKEVTAVKTKTTREESKMVFSRHTIKPGASVVLGEDVANNFSTTDKAIKLVEEAGGIVVAIIALLNRSLTVEKTYSHNGIEIPVIALVRKPIPEYKQEDSEVAEDIKNGNFVPKPKNEWERLMKAMNKKPELASV